MGGWVCTEIAIEADQPLTTSALRSIPLTRIIEQLLTQPLPDADRAGGLDLKTGRRDRYDGAFDELLVGLPDSDVRKFYMGNAAKPTKARRRDRRGSAGPTDDDLERFAQAYRWALQFERHRPVAAAAERMNIGRATAHRWLKLMQARGTGG